MKLTADQKRQLFDEGYVVIPGAVPRVDVDAALRLVNHALGEEGLPKQKLPEFRARTFCPDLVNAPEITGLYRSGLAQAVDEAIGPGKVRAPREGQIALRFPQRGAPGRAHPHIDGMYSADNGVKKGTIYHFTALGGVFLSDVTAENAGNLTVWPGTHHTLEAYFQKHGPESLLQGFPPIDLPPPRPVLARAGDALLAHYALAHGIGPNVSPHVRYAVFYRLFHVEHDRLGLAALTDIWRQWDGMREMAAEKRG